MHLPPIGPSVSQEVSHQPSHDSFSHANRPYACDVIISWRPRLGVNRITRKSSCQSHVVADHKRVQSNDFDPQNGGAMTSMHKVYNQCVDYLPHWRILCISFDSIFTSLHTKISVLGEGSNVITVGTIYKNKNRDYTRDHLLNVTFINGNQQVSSQISQIIIFLVFFADYILTGCRGDELHQLKCWHKY